jgi:hypothetical protein
MDALGDTDNPTKMLIARRVANGGVNQNGREALGGGLFHESNKNPCPHKIYQRIVSQEI